MKAFPRVGDPKAGTVFRLPTSFEKLGNTDPVTGLYNLEEMNNTATRSLSLAQDHSTGRS
jgi:hypothetical protein